SSTALRGDIMTSQDLFVAHENIVAPEGIVVAREDTAGTEKIEYNLLQPFEFSSNLLTIVSESNVDAPVTDDIATQLVSDMGAEDPDPNVAEQPVITTSAISMPPSSSISYDQRTASIENDQDENTSPNTSAKRCNPGYEKSNKKHSSSAMKFRSFEINWSKISDTQMARLDSLQEYRLKNPNSAVPRTIRFKKNELSTLVNNIVEQLRNIDTDISAAVMETVSKQMLHKYPCMEILDDDGFGNGLSHMTIKHKMINRNTYLNRLDSLPRAAPTLNHKPKYRRAGTMQEYWKSTTDQCSKDILSKLRRDEPNLLTEDFMSVSQGYIRSQLDQKKELKVILSEWPVLRRRILLSYHFKKATEIDIDTLRTYFIAKKAKIIEFSASQKANRLNEGASDYDVFYFLARAVGESLDDLVLKKEIGTSIEAIHDESSGPVLICVDEANDSAIYYVFAEQTRLSEGTKDIICAFQDLRCMQYVHGFMYLKKVAKFLELIQEYLLKFFPAKGSKSNAIRIGQQQRMVQKVITALSEYGAAT
ncbi:uncharacterized protein LOC134204028, partial [Armigeres subalbatus]|uniref:uncharacterized protein LOC134204028 n=1 Tax=Armigeres subalbatus TaxID=124917 RepID=UPI002ED4046F